MEPDGVNYPNYDEFVLQVEGPLGWSAIGAYETREELLAILDQLRKQEIPFDRRTYRFFKVKHEAGAATYSRGNRNPLASNPDRNYPNDYKMPNFLYRGEWEY